LYTAATVPIAVIAFDFDPLVHIGSSLTVRWQTLALALVVFVCLSTMGTLARRARLRADDLVYIAIGAAPGAIVAGRVGYALLVPEAFAVGPTSLIDPAVGGLELGLGVVGGIASAAVVATLLGSSVGRWAHIATIPLLVAIAGGKLSMVLGGSGQGSFFDGAWRPRSSDRGRGSHSHLPFRRIPRRSTRPSARRSPPWSCSLPARLARSVRRTGHGCLSGWRRGASPVRP